MTEGGRLQRPSQPGPFRCDIAMMVAKRAPARRLVDNRGAMFHNVGS
jgi:hypothetical protein